MLSLKSLISLEWVAVLAVALVAYGVAGYSWWLFALLILAPDLSMLFYLGGPVIGAIAYNAVHTLIAPGLLAIAAWLWSSPPTSAISLILLAHIAADRMLGYGLKHTSGFKDTHLGRIGRG